ncbi:MAG: hypothetical protein ACFCVG_00625 [Kineosporiaceae bacterium]
MTAALAEPTPAGDPGRPPDELIGPGIAGFVAIFLLAAAVILLIRDMNRRVRRLRHREAARREAAGEEHAGEHADRDGEAGDRS